MNSFLTLVYVLDGISQLNDTAVDSTDPRQLIALAFTMHTTCQWPMISALEQDKFGRYGPKDLQPITGLVLYVL